MTNPTNSWGGLEFVFYEERGDRNFYRSDWAGGVWTAHPIYQRYYRPDPSRRFGDHFLTTGWFEVWMSMDEMLIDVVVTKFTRNLISGGVSGVGGAVENISQRSVQLSPKRMPLLQRIRDLMGQPVSPFDFHKGITPSTTMELSGPSLSDLY